MQCECLGQLRVHSEHACQTHVKQICTVVTVVVPNLLPLVYKKHYAFLRPGLLIALLHHFAWFAHTSCNLDTKRTSAALYLHVISGLLPILLLANVQILLRLEV